MEAISTPTHKPAFVIGPYLSPFSSPAMDSENLVAVASGKSALVLFCHVNSISHIGIPVARIKVTTQTAPNQCWGRDARHAVSDIKFIWF